MYCKSLWIKASAKCINVNTEELKKLSMREREHFYQRDFAYPAFTNFKLIDNELWFPGKTGHLSPSP